MTFFLLHIPHLDTLLVTTNHACSRRRWLLPHTQRTHPVGLFFLSFDKDCRHPSCFGHFGLFFNSLLSLLQRATTHTNVHTPFTTPLHLFSYEIYRSTILFAFYAAHARLAYLFAYFISF
jgi:hypothetical protein